MQNVSGDGVGVGGWGSTIGRLTHSMGESLSLPSGFWLVLGALGALGGAFEVGNSNMGQLMGSFLEKIISTLLGQHLTLARVGSTVP